MSEIIEGNDQGSSSSPVAQLRFLAHLKEYGIVYAVAYFIAQDLGLLSTIATTAGGVC